MTIVEFLTARLDEEAASVRTATRECGPNWRLETNYRGSEDIFATGVDQWGAPIQERLVVDQLDAGDEVARYIARHDPAWAMREIEAKRAILREYVSAVDLWERESEAPDGVGALQAVIRHTASVYADHPDYAAIE